MAQALQSAPLCGAIPGFQSDGVAAARSSVTPLCVSYLPDQWAVAEEAGSINVPAGKLPLKFGYLVQLLPREFAVCEANRCHCNNTPGRRDSGGHVCIVTPAGLCIVSTQVQFDRLQTITSCNLLYSARKRCENVQTWKLVHFVTADIMGIAVPTSASCAITVHSADSASLYVALNSDLTGCVAIYSLPLSSVAALNAVAAVGGSGQRKGQHLSEVGYDDVDSSLAGGMSAVRVVDSGTRAVVGITGGESVYADPAVPLSYFMHPSMVADRDDTESSDNSPFSRPRRSLLDAEPRFAQPTTAKEAPVGPRSASSASGAWETPKKDKQGKMVDQPITFQKKIKSSGYGQIPQDSFERKRYFQQQEKLKKQSAEKKAAAVRATLQRSNSAPSAGTGEHDDCDATYTLPADRGAHIRHYPLNCGPVQTHLRDCDVTVCPSISADASCPIYSIAYSSDGSLLGVASANSSVMTLRLPTNKYGGEGE
jgi:hypothetical protein